ncbi:MAG: putative molybdenum carrier protein [Desulfobacteraceae bacterium]|nr:putative molybdenum carrier protein [Desulfobacteraceae bacterium]
MIKKIISGGQIGADQGALDVAIKYGIPHGGWIQKGRKTQSGILPSKYHLKEMSTPSFKDRIEQNVIDSHGSVVISHGTLTGGADYCLKMAQKHGRPCLHIDLNTLSEFTAASRLNAWIKENDIEVLNVNGSRTSEDSNIYKDTMDIIEGAVLLGLVKTPSAGLWTDRNKDDTSEEPMPAPASVDEAVSQIIVDMPLKDRVNIANMEREALESLDSTLGVFIQNRIFKEDVDGKLFASCLSVSGKDKLDGGGAAFVIIEKLWEKLQKTHRMRIV